MARFEIQAPDGRTFEIEGETTPSEEELNEIFAQMPARKVRPTIGVTREFEFQQDIREQFEKLHPTEARVRLAAPKLYPEIGEIKPETKEIIMRDIERRELKSVEETMKMAALAMVPAGAAQAIPKINVINPQVIGGFAPRVAQAATTALGRGLQVLKEAGKQGGISGMARTLESLSAGEGTEEALKKGLKTGLTVGAISAGIPATKAAVRGIGKGIKNMTKSLSAVPKEAINTAIDNPTILTTPQEEPFELAQNMVDKTLPNFYRRIGEQFDEGLRGLKTAGKTVNLTGMKEATKGLDLAILGNKIKSAIRDQALAFDETLVDDFLAGKKISFDKARQVNRMMHDILGKTATKQFEGGLISKMKQIKNVVSKGMARSVPGIDKINKDYAKSTNLLKKISKKITEDQFTAKSGAEGYIKRLGSQISGANRNLKRDMEIIGQLDDITGANLTQRIKQSFAADAFNTTDLKPVMTTIYSGLGGSLGAAAGAQLGAPATGAMIGSIGTAALRRPEVARGVITGLDKISQTRIGQALPQIRGLVGAGVEAARGLAPAIGMEMTREEAELGL